MSTQSKWDLTLAVAGILYLAMVLFLGIEVPLFGVALLVLAAYALIRPHRANSRSQWRR